jgi:hypothetical protein
MDLTSPLLFEHREALVLALTIAEHGSDAIDWLVGAKHAQRDEPSIFIGYHRRFDFFETDAGGSIRPSAAVAGRRKSRRRSTRYFAVQA